MIIAALRHNNPGNVSLPITGWTGLGRIVGLPDQPGYAEFATMSDGYAAFLLRLSLFIRDGKNTIRTIGALYAADPHWPAAVSALSGINLDAVLTESDTPIMQMLAGAIVRQETGLTIQTLAAQAVTIDFSIPTATATTPVASPKETPMTDTPAANPFNDVLGFAESLATVIGNILTKGPNELTTIETAIKQNAPVVASAVDGLITMAETITAVVDPALEPILVTLKSVFDGLVKVIEAV